MEKGEVIVKDIMGRLGNILFSYVCGYYVSVKTNRKLKIKKGYIDDRYLKFVIDNGFIPGDLDFVDDISSFRKITEKNAITYSPIDVTGDIFISGYRQSPGYWDDDESFVQGLIKPQDSVIEKIKDVYSDIDFDDIVSINIRRGDYTRNKNINLLGLQSVEYFIDAIEKCGRNKRYLIVSEDIEWCKDKFKGYDIVFADRPVVGVDDIIKDFWIMSLCSENIISNSTFGWWGAYLNKHKDKKIYYPAPWFKSIPGDDIIPNDDRWIKIESMFL